MQTYEARIRGANEPLVLDEANLPGREESRRRRGQEVRSGGGDTLSPHAAGARWRATSNALCLVRSGRDADAEKDLAAVQSSSDEGLVALARFQLAQIYDRTGKGPDAVKLYQQLADNPSLFVPRPVALLALADHYSFPAIPSRRQNSTSR